MLLTNHVNKADRINKKCSKCWCCEATVKRSHYNTMQPVTLLFDSVARQIQLINHSFKKHSVKFEMKSQTTLQVVQSYSQAVPSTLRLRSESFAF